jgi:type I restriction enzyme M protein
MAEAFNLNSFLQTYKQNTYDPTKQHTNAERNMEQKRLQQAEEAVNSGLVNTKKTELLFVSLMIQLLKVGGRGMSVVPEGVLFGSSKAHLNLRKELVDHQKLIGVISMPSGVFMAPTAKGSSSKGAGVKTAYLIFQKTDCGGTDNVWFYNMENDGYTLDVKRTKIEGSDIPDIEYRFEHLEEEFKRSSAKFNRAIC